MQREWAEPAYFDLRIIWHLESSPLLALSVSVVSSITNIFVCYNPQDFTPFSTRSDRFHPTASELKCAIMRDSRHPFQA